LIELIDWQGQCPFNAEKIMFCPKPARSVFLAALSMLFLLSPPTPLWAESLPRAVLIIDGSGSMWGRIDKREKIVIVREQLADKITLLKGNVDLGIMSYGHRRRRDCRDIEMIIPIGAVEPQSYGEAIKRLLPRGKTPVASALQMAAKSLFQSDKSDAKSAKSHIILVADGVENCRQDPCKTARVLASKYPNLTIDVIGFAVSDDEARQLQCISNNSKGRFRRAKDTKSLQTSIEQIFATLGPATRPQPVKKKNKKKIPPGLYLSVGLSQKGAPLEKDVAWRIYRKGKSSTTSTAPLKRATGASVFLHLPEGKYHIEARHGPLIASRDVELRADSALKLRLSFNVGVITASARLGKNTPPSNDIIFSLYDISSGPPGASNIIDHKQQKKAVFYLPPGKYRLKAKTGDTQVWQDFTLQA
jgi:Ca-activated chloride channel family protein